MIQRIHIQVLDNPIEDVFFDEYVSETAETNKILTDELSKELDYFYPSVVCVEYIDLFMNGETQFEDIRELLRVGAVNTPVVLINGIVRIHGGIPPTVIRREVEKLLSSGPFH